MKKEIHPSNYREVVFKDMSNDEIFITRSTVASRETIEVDGKEYPLVKLEITSASHPFFTGKHRIAVSLIPMQQNRYRGPVIIQLPDFCAFFFQCAENVLYLQYYLIPIGVDMEY